jgi:RNA polymerase sigma factor (TIGR02999 family)
LGRHAWAVPPDLKVIASSLAASPRVLCSELREFARKGVTMSKPIDGCSGRPTATATGPPPIAGTVTTLLRAWSDGQAGALEELLPLVEAELRRVARAYMARERRNHTLQVTALVNEAFLRVTDAAHLQWHDRTHFVGIAARLMRRVLVDHARRRAYGKRGGHVECVTLDEALVAAPPRSVDLLALDRALETFATVDPRKARVIELRFFGGLSQEETAELLQVSLETVKRDWRLAKIWLRRELRDGPVHRRP